MKTAALVAVTVALALGGGACNSSSPTKKIAEKDPTGTTAPPAGTASQSPAAGTGGTPTTLKTQSGGKTAAGATTATSAAPAGGNTSPTTAASSSPQSLPPGDFTSSLSFEHKCVNPAGTQRIIVHTKPNATVAYLVVYSDGKNHGGSSGGIADGSGTFSETFVVKPDAPKGQATGYANSVASDKQQSSAQASFNVGGC